MSRAETLHLAPKAGWKAVHAECNVHEHQPADEHIIVIFAQAQSTVSHAHRALSAMSTATSEGQQHPHIIAAEPHDAAQGQLHVPVVHARGCMASSDFWVYGTKLTKGRLQRPTSAGMKARYNKYLQPHSEADVSHSKLRPCSQA